MSWVPVYVHHLLHIGKREDPRDEVKFSLAIRNRRLGQDWGSMTVYVVEELVLDRPIHYTTQRKDGYGSGTVVFENRRTMADFGIKA